MEAVEFCEMRHGYCACRKAGEVHCLQILRLVEDPVEIRKAQERREAAERKRRSRYIKDDPPPMRYGGFLHDHQIQMMEAAQRLMGSEMLIPKSRMYEEMYRGIEPVVEKTATQVMIEKYSRDDAMFSVDFSKIEERMMETIREADLTLPIEPRVRRLGSSSKPHVKFLPDPVKEKPK